MGIMTVGTADLPGGHFGVQPCRHSLFAVACSAQPVARKFQQFREFCGMRLVACQAAADGDGTMDIFPFDEALMTHETKFLFRISETAFPLFVMAIVTFLFFVWGM